MPSLVVHLALSGLLGAAWLDKEFNGRALAVVLGITVIPDLDVFAGFVIPGGHRSVLHTLLIPLGLGMALAYDTRVRDTSIIADRWGKRGVRIGWVAIGAYAISGTGLDLLYGVNPFYPFYDQFYRLSGELLYSTQRGIVQTVVDLGGNNGIGSAQEVGHISSGVDPSQGSEPASVDRVFPVARAGWELYLIVVSALVCAGRLIENGRS
jgi:inner membrane protein